MVKEGSSLVHGGARQLRWPVELRVVPLSKLLLLLVLGVVALVGQVILVVALLLEDGSLLATPVNSLRLLCAKVVL